MEEFICPECGFCTTDKNELTTDDLDENYELYTCPNCFNLIQSYELDEE